MNSGAMNSGFLPQILMAAAVVLLLALVTPRQAIVSSAGFIVAYLLMQVVPLSPSWNEVAVVGLWISVVATAVLVYLPPPRWARPSGPGSSASSPVWRACGSSAVPG